MSDLIDRAALLEKMDKKFFATCPEGDEQLGYLNSRNLIRTAPAVDAVPVVRCKDCKRWVPGKARGGDSLDDMQIIGRCPLSNFMRREKDFCSFGERKET